MSYLISWKGGLYRGGPQVLSGHFGWYRAIENREDVKRIEGFISVSFGPAKETVVITNIFKFEERPADVRMSAASLLEMQKVAAARAVEKFGEFEARERETDRIAEDARHYADEIRSGKRPLT